MRGVGIGFVRVGGQGVAVGRLGGGQLGHEHGPLAGEGRVGEKVVDLAGPRQLVERPEAELVEEDLGRSIQ